MGPEFISSTRVGVCRRAPTAFPDSSSVLDKLQSASRVAPAHESWSLAASQDALHTPASQLNSERAAVAEALEEIVGLGELGIRTSGLRVYRLSRVATESIHVSPGQTSYPNEKETLTI